MRCTVLALTLPLLLASVSSPSSAREDGVTSYDGFEHGVPDHWVSGRPGALSTSDLHSKYGSHSLRWDFRAGDTITVRPDFGDITRRGGYGGSYGRASFGVWIYCREPIEGSLKFEFRTGEQTDAWFEFALHHTGWESARMRYDTGPGPVPGFEGKVLQTTDNILISAPPDVENGTIFIDLLVYNGIVDFRHGYIPAPEKWQAPTPDPEQFPLPERVTQADMEGAEYLGHSLEAFWGRGFGKVTAERLAELRERFEAFEIVRDEHGIRGRPVLHPQRMDSGVSTFYVGLIEDGGLMSATVAGNLMRDMSRAHYAAEDEETKEQIAQWYCLLAEHLRDQGMTAGTGFGWGWYYGRPLGEANFVMREPLRERGLLDWAEEFLNYSYGHSRIFDDGTINPNMDYFFINMNYMLFGCLMQTDPADRVRHLRAFGRRVNLDILHQGPNGYKPDGSAYHHGFNYFAYSMLGTLRFAEHVVEPLSHTPYAVSGEALQRLKQVALPMRFYCNQTDLPIPLSGRHPFGGTLAPVLLSTLAKCGSPDGSSELDAELAAAYLRLVPGDQDKEPFASHGIEPEPHPNGNMTMNFAGLSAHRRDDWLALVKGYSRYVAYGEIYETTNRFGRYMSNGYLDILGGGDPISREGSGIVQDGWDWNRLDGTTVVYLPLDKLRAVSSGTETIASDQTFVGGLSHRGSNGAFVMQLQGGRQHEPTFRGKKTYFFFDDHIICLGSDITNENTERHTHTNLFQKHLPEPDEDVTVVNGKILVGLGVNQQLAADRPNWIIDPQSTGYWLPAGQAIHVGRMRQQSRNQSDTEDTEGDFATGWVDHGTAPGAGWYEYAVIVRATPERMEQFAQAMTDEAQPPYEVLQRDSRAHIVYDRAARTWGAVLFEAQRIEAQMPLLHVDRACLVMIEQLDDGSLHLSVADPDLNLQEYVSIPRPLRVTVRGAWQLTHTSDEFRVADRGSEGTVVEVTCRHGRSYDMELTLAE